MCTTAWMDTHSSRADTRMTRQVLVSHMSHIAEDAHSAPGKALGDGALHVLVLRKPVSRLRLLSIFLQFEEGKHVHEPEVRAAAVFVRECA